MPMFEFVAPMTVLIVLFYMVGSVIHHILRSRKDIRVAEMYLQARTRVLERLGTSEEVLEFFKQGGGDQWVPSSPAEGGAVPTRLLNSLQVGVVILFIGVGLWLTGSRIYDRDVAEGMVVLAGVGIAAGLGFVASSIVGFVAARRLGLVAGSGADQSSV